MITCSVASPTASNHLTRKDYINNNFILKMPEIDENKKINIS